MFLRQITFSILPGTGGRSHEQAQRTQMVAQILCNTHCHHSCPGTESLRGNGPVTDYAGHWGSTKRAHQSTGAKVFKGQSCEPRVSAVEMCLGPAGPSSPCQSPTALQGPALHDQCPGSRVLVNTKEGSTAESPRLFLNFLAFQLTFGRADC